MKLKIIASLLLCCLLGGCVGLPIPHKITAVPEISGQLKLEETNQERHEFRYEITMLHEAEKRSGRLAADDSGNFKIDSEKKWNFIFWIPLLPFDFFWTCSFELFDDEGDLVYAEEVHQRTASWLSKFPVELGEIDLNNFDKKAYKSSQNNSIEASGR